MFRTILILCFILHFRSSPIFCQPSFANTDMLEEYRETKNGVTLITVIPLHDSAQHKILDAFLRQLSKKLKRPSQLKIMIIVDIGFRPPWNAIIGYDTLRFDLKFIDGDCAPKKKNSVVILTNNGPIDTSYKPPKEVAVDWSGSCDRTKKELGLKILYKWWDSDSGSIVFDRIYSLAKYDSEHIEEIKKNQRRIEMKYYGGEWLFSVLTIDTAEIKRMPLESLEFDPNNINVETKDKTLILIVSSIILLVIISFFLFKKSRSNLTNTV
jgi:hypothetical protein